MTDKLGVASNCGMQEPEAKEKFGHNLHIDRKEGALGYVDGNLVLACHRCNVVKNGYLTHAQMMQVAGMFFGGPVNNHEALVRALENLLRFCNDGTEYELQHLSSYSPYLDAEALLAVVGNAGSGS